MKTIQFHGTQIRFPDACLVCLGSGSQRYQLERTFTYGRRGLTLHLGIPLCYDHHKIVSARTRAQRLVERLSPFLGIVPGLAACAGLLAHWSATNQLSPLFLTLPLALFIGIGAQVTIWVVTLFWIAPLFAAAETKEVLRKIQIRRYDPFRQILELTFDNDTAAELTARENLDILIVDRAGLRPYRISAHILDHDIRLSRTVKTQVLLDHRPADQEARGLLQPEIDKIMVQQLGVDTFYEVDRIEVEEIR